MDSRLPNQPVTEHPAKRSIEVAGQERLAAKASLDVADEIPSVSRLVHERKQNLEYQRLQRHV